MRLSAALDALNLARETSDIIPELGELAGLAQLGRVILAIMTDDSTRERLDLTKINAQDMLTR